ncbi:MAG: alpha/beta hydrolase-fold protein [Xanthomonadales bacterium]|nr:alpha/beta hydrolase-fold protein [Xanthomonadales bacterium]
MKSVLSVVAGLALLLTSMAPAFAQQGLPVYLAESAYPLTSAQVFNFKSEKAGRTYKIMVHLPGGYDDDDSRYPVLYTVDGQWHFPIAVSVAGGLYYDRGARKSIVVGITWEGDEAEANRLRVHDFTPTGMESYIGSGKADNYLNFLQYELIPYMAKHFRTSNDRTLSGSSFGGLLTLYCLFTRPTVFTDYLASTPATWWDDVVLNKYRTSFAENGLESSVRLYAARGEMEHGQLGIDAFMEELKAKNVKNLEVKFDVIKGAGHGGLNPEAFTRGMQFIFKKERIKIGEADLSAYAGFYKGETGSDGIHIRVHDGKLYLKHSQANAESQLVAVKENLFYLPNSGTESTFLVNDYQQVTHVMLTTERGEFSFSRHK